MLVAKHPDLQEIGVAHGSDKFTVHKFGPVYERYLGEMRFDPVRILEIGIGGEDFELGGPSLTAWAEYFPNARVVGIDLFDKSALDTDRITTVVCDQSDQAALAQLNDMHGPFDIIIDDGSHKADPTLLSFFTLFHTLRPGGYYVIEDIQTSYWPHYGGSSIAGDTVNSAAFWIKRMVDVINRNEILWDDHPARRSGFVASELHVHHNIAFIRRGDVSGKSAVLTDALRKEWLELDFNMQKLSEKVARKAADDADFRLKLLQLMSLAAE